MNQYHYNLGMAFEEVAKKHAKHVAIRNSENSIFYEQLIEYVECLAKVLINSGLQRGEVIVIASNKGILTYALMLAALRLGIPYVNIDVHAPASRNSSIIQLSNSTFLFFDDPIYSQSMDDLATRTNCQVTEIKLQTLPLVSSSDREKQLQWMRQIDGSSIAYLMFTSGSTGIPKGVAITHQNVLHLIAWGQHFFQIQPQDNFAQLSPLYFDNSVFDFYVALFSGASLSPVSRSLLSKPYDLVDFVGKMNCTIWFSVPSLLIYLMTMKAMTTQALPKLRNIVFGGEGYPKMELQKLYQSFAAQASLVNVYGPTECTCICSAYALSEKDFTKLDGLPPLGTLNPNFDYLILDEQEKETNHGELCLIGPNVGAGYFNESERTANSFITLKESKRFMKRMYKTGDLVKELDGILYFVGRKDNQIKHMGYRIELEEIEQALVKLPHIYQAAVVYHRVSVAYGKLIGFVASTETILEQQVLEALSNLLPEYMIPSRIVVQQGLPISPNGKVDRQRLLFQI